MVSTRSAIAAGVVQHRVGFAPRHQLPIGPVGAVGERLGHGPQAEAFGGPSKNADPESPSTGSAGVHGVHRLGDGGACRGW